MKKIFCIKKCIEKRGNIIRKYMKNRKDSEKSKKMTIA